MIANSGVEAWRTDLSQVLESAPVTVTDVRIGVFYTAALLSSDHTGVALTRAICPTRSVVPDRRPLPRRTATWRGRMPGLWPTMPNRRSHSVPLPPTFFARGVHVLGGIRVLDGPRMLQIVSEGGSGYYFQREAEKVSVIRNGTV